MGLLSKKVASLASPEAAVTLIAHGTRVDGVLSGGGHVHVDGTVHGDILRAEYASVGTTGRFAGSIKAHHVLISGCFEGTIDCGRLEITDTGLVVGELLCDELTIDGGGRFSGSRRPREPLLSPLMISAPADPAGEESGRAPIGRGRPAKATAAEAEIA